MNAFIRRQWQITEYPFRPERIAHTETIMTAGNGLVGVRGSFEEGYPGDTPATLAAGVFSRDPAGKQVPELVALPNWLALDIAVDGEAFRLDRGRILGFERVLDMKTGTLRRGVLWFSPQGTVLRLAFERFASLDNPHVLALQVLIQVLSDGDHRISVRGALDASVTNPGGIDYWETKTTRVEDQKLVFDGTVAHSGYRVAMQGALLVDRADAVWRDTSEPHIPARTAEFELAANEKAVVTKLVALHTSRDSDAPTAHCAQSLNLAVKTGYDALKVAHDAAWSCAWDRFDIVIEGDELAQRALRFCTYHLLIAIPPADEHVSIGAKTLSGPGYKGHVFWDTESFLLPPVILGDPAAARRLLMYRYHNLAGARAKAAEAGYEGAMFPWESADTGEEVTPRWLADVDATGDLMRIWTGDHEQHISTDIAYAVMQYWRWSGDDEWFAQFGAEILLDTARFWGSRAEYNPDQDRYELRMQIGPDEYHENVDNSVFTNRMVVWHLRQALDALGWLGSHAPDAARRLVEALDLTPDRLDHWRKIAAKMWIPLSDEGGGVFEQFEGFFQQLRPFNLADYTPRTTNMDWILGHEETQALRVIKQADVVMLMALLGEELGDAAFLRRNWDLYSTVVDHGSSLSPSTHARVAARLGLIDTAYDLFIYSATLDLEDHKGNVRDGIHGACCGGVWQALVFGFCGLYLTPDGPRTRPALPAHWRRVSFKVTYHGQVVDITLP